MNIEVFDSRSYRRGRAFVIAEAAVEFFIHLCVTTTFLTAVLTEMQVSTALQGVISAIASLACSVQLISVFAVKKTYPCRRWVSILNLFSQLMFVLLYCIPLTNLTKGIRVASFIIMLMLAYGFQHYLTPSRVNWQMSLVADDHRGRFTAKKEIFSLVGGMIFSQAAGMMVDYFKAKGDMHTCFIIFAVTITVLSLLHLYFMLGTKEPEPEKQVVPKPFKEIIHIVFGKPQLRLVILFDSLFMVATVSLHYYTVYMTGTMGFKYGHLTLVAIFHAAFRAFVSPFLGRFADKHSWVSCLRLCMLVLTVGFIVFIFCSPQNAMVIYPIFSLCYEFSLGGTNAGKTNLCLDYVKHEDRRYILGVQHAISGIVAFVATLGAAALVEYIEMAKPFGANIYPQQILFGISAVMLILMNIFLMPKLKLKRGNKNDDDQN